jgi:hypothetical protein
MMTNVPPPALPDVTPRTGLVANPQSGFAYGKSRKPPPGAEELERKARFFAKQKMRPKSKKQTTQ